MSNALKTVQVQLICRHYAVSIKDYDTLADVYCPRCAKMRKPVAVIEFGRAVCRTCDHWDRKGRVDTVKTAAYKHSADHPSHMVQCYQSGKLLFTATLARVQPELPLFELPPPF